MTGTVRPVSDGDCEAVIRLIRETVRVSYAGVYPPKAHALFDEIHSTDALARRRRDGAVVVLEEDGEVTATGALEGDTIFAVFVDPNRQGGGRGRRVMAALEDEARARGMETVRLFVSLPSRPFYESLGYSIEDEVVRDLGDGQELRFWNASKAL